MVVFCFPEEGDVGKIASSAIELFKQCVTMRLK